MNWPDNAVQHFKSFFATEAAVAGKNYLELRSVTNSQYVCIRGIGRIPILKHYHYLALMRVGKPHGLALTFLYFA